jgi:quercetin dioxygenase-like cupin family protein
MLLPRHMYSLKMANWLPLELSQRHQKRLRLHRIQVVVGDIAKVLNVTQELTLEVNESTFIPATHKHRLENIGAEQLVMIEVQTGSYLGEDDTVHFSDVYGRVS